MPVTAQSPTNTAANRYATQRASESADILYGWFYSAAIGGSVVSLIFLALDVIHGHPLITPSILGSVAFMGASADAVTTVNMAAVAAFTVTHLLAFGVLGLMAAVLYGALKERRMAATLVTALVLFGLMQGGMVAASVSVMPGILARLGELSVLTANGLGALSMALFLHWAHAPEVDTSDEHEEELSETPATY